MTDRREQPVTLAAVEAELADVTAQEAEAGAAFKEAETRYYEISSRRSALERLAKGMACHLGLRED